MCIRLDSPSRPQTKFPRFIFGQSASCQHGVIHFGSFSKKRVSIPSTRARKFSVKPKLSRTETSAHRECCPAGMETLGAANRDNVKHYPLGFLFPRDGHQEESLRLADFQRGLLLNFLCDLRTYSSVRFCVQRLRSAAALSGCAQWEEHKTGRPAVPCT